jgi:hypothetical protein
MHHRFQTHLPFGHSAQEFDDANVNYAFLLLHLPNPHPISLGGHLQTLAERVCQADKTFA